MALPLAALAVAGLMGLAGVADARALSLPVAPRSLPLDLPSVLPTDLPSILPTDLPSILPSLPVPSLPVPSLPVGTSPGSPPPGSSPSPTTRPSGPSATLSPTTPDGARPAAFRPPGVPPVPPGGGSGPAQAPSDIAPGSLVGLLALGLGNGLNLEGARIWPALAAIELLLLAGIGITYQARRRASQRRR